MNIEDRVTIEIDIAVCAAVWEPIGDIADRSISWKAKESLRDSGHFMKKVDWDAICRRVDDSMGNYKY